MSFSLQKEEDNPRAKELHEKNIRTYDEIRNTVGMNCTHSLLFGGEVGRHAEKVSTTDQNESVNFFDVDGHRLPNFRRHPVPTNGVEKKHFVSTGDDILSAKERDTLRLKKRFVTQNRRAGRDLAKVCRSLDSKDSGFLSYSEFSKALQHAGIVLTGAERQRLFNTQPLSLDGTIDYSKFLHTAHSWDSDSGATLPMDEEVDTTTPRILAKYKNGYYTTQMSDGIFGPSAQVFKKYKGANCDKRGYSTEEKLSSLSQQKVLSRLTADPKTLQLRLEAMDVDKDGTVSKEEFRKGLSEMGIQLCTKDANSLFAAMKEHLKEQGFGGDRSLSLGADDGLHYPGVVKSLKMQATHGSIPGQVHAQAAAVLISIAPLLHYTSFLLSPRFPSF